jgi:hypothetical protein
MMVPIGFAQFMKRLSMFVDLPATVAPDTTIGSLDLDSLELLSLAVAVESVADADLPEGFDLVSNDLLHLTFGEIFASVSPSGGVS